MTINNLPDEVLIEIFDLYRHTFGDQLSSERVWNNKNGWFKLAHVCHNWRSVVLASPSRLRLRLYFASNTPTRAVVLERLSHLPIIVDYSDYSNNSWKASALKRWSSALRYPNRVCRIAIRGIYHTSEYGITKTLDMPFPALESLELHHITSIECLLRSPSFMTSIQSLRHLRLERMCLTSVLPFLWVTRSLVDLTLGINKVSSMEGTSLLTHLQHMPHLRNLQVFLQLYRSAEMPPATSILLPELSSFRIQVVGDCTASVEWFVAGLDTPSLREFHISVIDFSGRLRIPYLTKFIRAVGIVFVTAQLTIMGSCLRTDMFAYSHSTDDPPSNIFTIKTQFTADPGIGLSAMLATLEDIFLSIPLRYVTCKLSPEDFGPCCGLLKEFRGVKVLRLHHGLERQVAELLRQPTADPQRPQPTQEEADPDVTTPSGTPIITNRSEFISHIFPSLEEIVLYARTPDTCRPIRDSEMEDASMLELFGPFVTARQEVGRPVKVFWSTDGQVPRYSVADPRYFSLWARKGG